MKKSYPTIVYIFRAYFNSIALLNKDLAAKQLIKLAFVEPLLNRSYKVIAFDAPAHGSSEGKRSNLLYFKKTARQIVERTGIPDLAIGHSLGANAIIMLAKEDHLQIPKVILISPLNRLMSVFEDFQELLSLQKALFNHFVKQFEAIAGYSFNDFYFHDYGKESPLNQVLLLHDEGDQITDFMHSKEMNELWPQTQLEPISGSGHYRILWQEQTLETVKEFIDQ